MRRRYATLMVAATMLLGAAPTAAAATPAKDGPQCAERLAAGPNDGWACSEETTVTVQHQGGPSLLVLHEKKGRKVSGGRITPYSFSPGTVSSDWTWNWSDTVWYGHGTTRVGKIRVVASINLNGRQAQSSWQVSVFEGPAIKARSRSRCLDDNSPTWLPDTVCSDSWVHQTTYTRSAIKNSDAPYLSEDERYWFEYSAWWLPQGDSNPSTSDGYWPIPNAPAMSAAFSCLKSRGATKVCIFG